MKHDLIPLAQNAVKGERVLIAAIDPETGRQIVNLREEAIFPPLVELRCAGRGFPWHDKHGHEWRPMRHQTDEWRWWQV
jgi:hypothetical protein